MCTRRPIIFVLSSGIYREEWSKSFEYHILNIILNDYCIYKWRIRSRSNPYFFNIRCAWKGGEINRSKLTKKTLKTYYFPLWFLTRYLITSARQKKFKIALQLYPNVKSKRNFNFVPLLEINPSCTTMINIPAELITLCGNKKTKERKLQNNSLVPFNENKISFPGKEKQLSNWKEKVNHERNQWH